MYQTVQAHPVGRIPPGNGGASGCHHPVEGASSGWSMGGARHVECSDCHNPHATGSPRASNTALEFNPNNAAYHAVVGASERFDQGSGRKSGNNCQ
jgi:hypothetical protein